MPIRAVCPGCNGRFNAPDQLLGKPTKCPKCATRFTVQAEGAANNPAPPEETAAPPRKRRLVGILAALGVMGFLMCGCLGIGGLAFFGGWLSSPSWQEYTSPEGGFTVLMPGKPAVEKKAVASIADAANLTEVALKGPPSDSWYAVHFYDLTDLPLDRDAFFNQVKDKAVAANAGSKAGADQFLTILSHTGKEFTIDLGNQKTLTRRVYLVENRVFVISALQPAAAADERAKFFDSFTISSLPPPFQPKTTKPETKPPVVVLPPIKPPVVVDKPTFPLSDDEQTLLGLINDFRVENGANRLQAVKKLFDAARASTANTAAGKKNADSTEQLGYRQVFRMNVSGQEFLPRQAFEEWIRGKASRITMLEPYEYIGLGVAKKGDMTYYMLILAGNKSLDD